MEPIGGEAVEGLESEGSRESSNLVSGSPVPESMLVELALSSDILGLLENTWLKVRKPWVRILSTYAVMKPNFVSNEFILMHSSNAFQLMFIMHFFLVLMIFH